MTLKKASIIGLVIGTLSALASVFCPIISIALQIKNVGIIGGADFPTFSYAFWSEGIYIILATFGIPLVLTSLFCLIFPNFVRENFSIKTTALALGISATGSLGLWCVLECLAILAFARPSEHPISYPASIIVGVLSLILFIILFALYCKARKGEVKILGAVLDVFTGGSFMLFFLFAEAAIIELARDVFHLLEMR